MRSTNKVAKYVAIALGLILAIFIISVIVKTTLGIFGSKVIIFRIILPSSKKMTR